MKIIFLFISLLNIVFFFWEYRKGAPDIYLPPSYKTGAGSSINELEIILPSELPSAHKLTAKADSSKDNTTQKTELQADDKHRKATLLAELKQQVVEKNTSPEKKKAIVKQAKQKPELDQQPGISAEKKIAEQVSFEIAKDSGVVNPLVIACYQLLKGEYTQDMFAQEERETSFKLELNKQEQRHISHYLVLTEVSDTLVEAEVMKQKINQQGIEGLWLIKQGDFNGRISLGSFSDKEKAEQAMQAFSVQMDQRLEVVPGHQTITVNQVKISVQDKQGITDFERQYSLIIDQRIKCGGKV